jgi:hypothetical protein
MTITLNITQLSHEINLAIKTIRTTLVRNPTALPPRLLIAGQKKLLWLRTDVENFYGGQLRVFGSNPDFSTKAKQSVQTPQKPEPRRGRPTKVEQLAKQSAKNKAI